MSFHGGNNLFAFFIEYGNNFIISSRDHSTSLDIQTQNPWATGTM